MTRSPSSSSLNFSSFLNISRINRNKRFNVIFVPVLLCLLAAQQCSAAYYGKLLGKLSQFHHGVSGEVYAVDARTLFIKDFTYDGEGPAAWFYGGTDKTVGRNGFKIPDEQGTLNVLKRYRKKDITLTLPEGQTLNKIKWFSVYCDEFAVNFGDVKIPRNFDYPRPQKLQGLSGIHGVSSEPVVVVDAQTLLVPGFTYDGEAPDAKFWVGSGPNPSPQGIRVPDENGKEQPLRRYDRKTIVLTLPNDLTVHQLGHFGVWCEAFTVDFGHVQIPTSLNVPPSLKMLGVSPQTGSNSALRQQQTASASSQSSTRVTQTRRKPGNANIIGSATTSRTTSTRPIRRGDEKTEKPTTYRPPSRRRVNVTPRSTTTTTTIRSTNGNTQRSTRTRANSRITTTTSASTPRTSTTTTPTTSTTEQYRIEPAISVGAKILPSMSHGVQILPAVDYRMHLDGANARLHQLRDDNNSYGGQQAYRHQELQRRFDPVDDARQFYYQQNQPNPRQFYPDPYGPYYPQY